MYCRPPVIPFAGGCDVDYRETRVRDVDNTCGPFARHQVIHTRHDEVTGAETERHLKACVCRAGYFAGDNYPCENQFYTRLCNDAENLVYAKRSQNCNGAYTCRVRCTADHHCFAHAPDPCLDNYRPTNCSYYDARELCGHGHMGCSGDCSISSDLAFTIKCKPHTLQCIPDPRFLKTESAPSLHANLKQLTTSPRSLHPLHHPFTTQTTVCVDPAVLSDVACNATEVFSLCGNTGTACVKHCCSTNASNPNSCTVGVTDFASRTCSCFYAPSTVGYCDAILTGDACTISRNCGPYTSTSYHRALVDGDDVDACTCVNGTTSDPTSQPVRQCAAYRRQCSFHEADVYCPLVGSSCYTDCSVSFSPPQCKVDLSTCVQNFTAGASTRYRACDAREMDLYCGDGVALCVMDAYESTFVNGSCACNGALSVEDTSFHPTTGLPFPITGKPCVSLSDHYETCLPHERARCGYLDVVSCRVRIALYNATEFTAAGGRRSSNFTSMAGQADGSGPSTFFVPVSGTGVVLDSLSDYANDFQNTYTGTFQEENLRKLYASIYYSRNYLLPQMPERYYDPGMNDVAHNNTYKLGSAVENMRRAPEDQQLSFVTEPFFLYNDQNAKACRHYERDIFGYYLNAWVTSPIVITNPDNSWGHGDILGCDNYVDRFTQPTCFAGSRLSRQPGFTWCAARHHMWMYIIGVDTNNYAVRRRCCGGAEDWDHEFRPYRYRPVNFHGSSPSGPTLGIDPNHEYYRLNDQAYIIPPRYSRGRAFRGLDVKRFVECTCSDAHVTSGVHVRSDYDPTGFNGLPWGSIQRLWKNTARSPSNTSHTFSGRNVSGSQVTFPYSTDPNSMFAANIACDGELYGLHQEFGIVPHFDNNNDPLLLNSNTNPRFLGVSGYGACHSVNRVCSGQYDLEAVFDTAALGHGVGNQRRAAGDNTTVSEAICIDGLTFCARTSQTHPRVMPCNGLGRFRNKERLYSSRMKLIQGSAPVGGYVNGNVGNSHHYEEALTGDWYDKYPPVWPRNTIGSYFSPAPGQMLATPGSFIARPADIWGLINMNHYCECSGVNTWDCEFDTGTPVQTGYYYTYDAAFYRRGNLEYCPHGSPPIYPVILKLYNRNGRKVKRKNVDYALSSPATTFGMGIRLKTNVCAGTTQTIGGISGEITYAGGENSTETQTFYHNSTSYDFNVTSEDNVTTTQTVIINGTEYQVNVTTLVNVTRSEHYVANSSSTTIAYSSSCYYESHNAEYMYSHLLDNNTVEWDCEYIPHQDNTGAIVPPSVKLLCTYTPMGTNGGAALYQSASLLPYFINPPAALGLVGTVTCSLSSVFRHSSVVNMCNASTNIYTEMHYSPDPYLALKQPYIRDSNHGDDVSDEFHPPTERMADSSFTPFPLATGCACITGITGDNCEYLSTIADNTIGAAANTYRGSLEPSLPPYDAKTNTIAGTKITNYTLFLREVCSNGGTYHVCPDADCTEGCVCDSGFVRFGITCKRSCPIGPNGIACSGHGNCTGLDSCSCESEYTGYSCSYHKSETCPKVHNVDGRVVLFGSADYVSSVFKACNSHGKCSANGTCECASDNYWYWTGTECKGKALRSPCQNGGVLTVDANQGPDGLGCDCTKNLAHPKRYSGTSCEYDSCPKNSTGSVCSGVGTCSCDNYGSCICTCPTILTGTPRYYQGCACEYNLVTACVLPTTNSLCATSLPPLVEPPEYPFSVRMGSVIPRGGCTPRYPLPTLATPIPSIVYECVCSFSQHGAFCQNSYCSGTPTCNGQTCVCSAPGVCACSCNNENVQVAVRCQPSSQASDCLTDPQSGSLLVGEFCETNVNVACGYVAANFIRICDGHGSCVKNNITNVYGCVCRDEYTGNKCQFADCSEDCGFYGTCTQGVCVCPSSKWITGGGVQTCTNGCTPPATLSTDKQTCACNDTGLIPPDCNSRYCPTSMGITCGPALLKDTSLVQPYLNIPYRMAGVCDNGTCICSLSPKYVRNTTTGLCDSYCHIDNTQSSFVNVANEVVCTCKEGYKNTGDPTCTKSRCLNGGSWVISRCVCLPVYTGVYCEPDLCGSQGDPHANGSVCVCNSGFKGTFCDTRVCYNGGVPGASTMSNCLCPAIYEGTNCQTVIPNSCVHGVRVNATGLCNCTYGYVGSMCDTYLCTHEGVYTNGTCVCSGDRRLNVLANDCIDHVCGAYGSVMEGPECTCIGGSTYNATATIAKCVLPCTVNGTWVEATQSCACRLNYTGILCDTPPPPLPPVILPDTTNSTNSTNSTAPSPTQAPTQAPTEAPTSPPVTEPPTQAPTDPPTEAPTIAPSPTPAPIDSSTVNDMNVIYVGVTVFVGFLSTAALVHYFRPRLRLSPRARQQRIRSRKGGPWKYLKHKTK